MSKFKNCVRYLEKILSLKVCFLEDRNVLIEPSLLRMCTHWHEEFENYFIVNVDYENNDKIKKYSFFVTTSEKKTGLEEIKGRITWPHIILIGKTAGVAYTNPNDFGISTLCYDILASSNFLPFRPILNTEEEKLITLNSKGLVMKKMASTDIQYKICYADDISYKYMRFLYAHNDVGVEYIDRKLLVIQ
ncbi:DNA-dependent RNA polymerase subunit rpo22 [Carp edema virus]|nr:DNA-dependent RNA polymerase subunit rpo22 [Carp edema virus]